MRHWYSRMTTAALIYGLWDLTLSSPVKSWMKRRRYRRNMAFWMVIFWFSVMEVLSAIDSFSDCRFSQVGKASIVPWILASIPGMAVNNGSTVSVMSSILASALIALCLWMWKPAYGALRIVAGGRSSSSIVSSSSVKYDGRRVS